ncbi:hypothetical protein [Thalassotalea marina]|uniref:Uncharacterized protein n=1 Tax=Thalassotalea marina TaxID=1673741 RepID=A0A919BA75_9GAMM|nr:hypothetical protein [Thalassotalea marina]GHF78111.1 hypothetical protein GCM10017161_01440 [Thalassotalea marina]
MRLSHKKKLSNKNSYFERRFKFKNCHLLIFKSDGSTEYKFVNFELKSHRVNINEKVEEVVCASEISPDLIIAALSAATGLGSFVYAKRSFDKSERCKFRSPTRKTLCNSLIVHHEVVQVDEKSCLIRVCKKNHKTISKISNSKIEQQVKIK